jgi:hypothetical protein
MSPGISIFLTLRARAGLDGGRDWAGSVVDGPFPGEEPPGADAQRLRKAQQQGPAGRTPPREPVAHGGGPDPQRPGQVGLGATVVVECPADPRKELTQSVIVGIRRDGCSPLAHSCVYIGSVIRGGSKMGCGCGARNICFRPRRRREVAGHREGRSGPSRERRSGRATAHGDPGPGGPGETAVGGRRVYRR